MDDKINKADELSDFMFYESYMEIIYEITEKISLDCAYEFALELTHYGVTGNRTHKLSNDMEPILISLIPYIDNSKKNKDRAIRYHQRTERKLEGNSGSNNEDSAEAVDEDTHGTEDSSLK